MSGPHDAAAALTVERARAALAQAEAGRSRADQRRARQAVMTARAAWLGGGDEFATLDASFPIVLFPVRVETRFRLAPGTPALLVRVYPDEMCADTHEPAVTADERRDGEAFWQSAWDTFGETREPWRHLVASRPAPRAAWIVRATTPSNVAEMPRRTGTGSGGTPGAGPGPAFPSVEERVHAWSRPPECRLLPERWLVVGYRRNAEVVRAVGRPIVEPLALAVDPGADRPDDDDVVGAGVMIGGDAAWTIDFDRAEAAGMALRVPIDAEGARTGFDRLIVTGVRGATSPASAATALAALIDAHHYTRGFAFVPQGTPTNNTADASSGFPPDDRDGRRSHAVEFGAPASSGGGSGSDLARALGVPATTFAHVEGAFLDEQNGAEAMNEALWPATWGYFLEQWLNPRPDAGRLAAVRGHFGTFVRGRGHLSAVRVGGTPYGVLVGSSLARWQPRDAASVLDAELPALLRRLLPAWVSEVGRVPRVGRTTDADADLLAVLEMDASARDVRVRHVLGADAQFNMVGFFGLSWNAWGARRAALADGALRLLGGDQRASRLMRAGFGPRALSFDGALVSEVALSETDALEFDYIGWLRTASIDELRTLTLPRPGIARPPLLLLLLRHALLLQIADAAHGVLRAQNIVKQDDRLEAELLRFGTLPNSAVPIWDRLGAAVPAITGTVPLGRFLLDSRNVRPEARAVAKYRTGLGRLQSLPTAELERLFTETLDVCSHRIDAWITSVYARRLQDIRTAHPDGCHLGAYAWVEGVRPRAAARRRVPQPSDFAAGPLPPGTAVQADTGGHIHAPSMAHAAAAAILRNAFLTRRGATADAYAVDLSSARVRTAMTLIDQARQDLPLGAALGRMFERGLRENHRPLPLEKYLDPLRRLFPLVAHKIEAGADSADTVAARNSVDGLALRAALREGRMPWGQSGLPASGPERQAIERELGTLEKTIDAVADLLTAEAVYQLARGSADRAAAALDALAGGARPPDPEVARAPRGGSTLTHRVALVLGGTAQPLSRWPDVGATPRAAVEPGVDGWIGALIGDPGAIRCRVRFPNEQGPPIQPFELTLRDVAEALTLRPIDVLASVTQAGGTGSELDALVAYAARRRAARIDAMPDVVFERAATWSRQAIYTFPELIELLRAARDLIAGARPLQAVDLLPDALAGMEAEADRMPDEARARAQQAGGAARRALDQLAGATAALEQAPERADLDPIRTALLAAWRLGVAGAIPRSARGSDPADRDPLLAQARTAIEELRRRNDGVGAAADAAAQVGAAFGADFPWLPRFRPMVAPLQQALGAGLTPPPEPREVSAWAHAAALVRPGLKRWLNLQLLATAWGSPPPALRVTQLPHVPGQSWAASPFATEENRPMSGALSLALVPIARPEATDPWVGLLLDSWVELIPNAVESPAVAFHYDDPGAEAPQALLVAVAPTSAPRWSSADLLAVLNETLDLAKVRGVDAELLPDLGQLVPAIYLAANASDDTVSTIFAGRLVEDRA